MESEKTDNNANINPNYDRWKSINIPSDGEYINSPRPSEKILDRENDRLDLSGYNLCPGKQIEVSFMRPSKRINFEGFNPEVKIAVEDLEQLYLDLCDEASNTEVKPFPQENGKAVIKAGTLIHRCPNNIETMRGISQLGIIASEWFGYSESEGEGPFCAFLNKIHNENDFQPESGSFNPKALNRSYITSHDDNLTLFFDNSHPIVDKLLHMDYFEYESLKRDCPEKIQERYSDTEINMFDNLLEPSTRKKSMIADFHRESIFPYCDWSAIPGGIPASLINGICLKSMDYTPEYLEELTNLFPNTTIFNSELDILYNPSQKI